MEEYFQGVTEHGLPSVREPNWATIKPAAQIQAIEAVGPDAILRNDMNE